MEASEILTPVRRVLRDSAGVRWDDATLLSYLYDAQVEITRLAEGANPSHLAVQLTTGEIRHDVLPTDTIRLEAVERNMPGATGTPGAIITEVPLEALNRLVRAGARGTDQGTIQNYAVRPEDPLRFYTFPAAAQGQWVEVLLARLPAALTTTEDVVSVLPSYKTILQLFVQGWALMEDTPTSDVPRGDAFVRQAYLALGFGEERADGKNRDR